MLPALKRKMVPGILNVSLLHIDNIKIMMGRFIIWIQSQSDLKMLYGPVDPSVEMISEADIILDPRLVRGFTDHILA